MDITLINKLQDFISFKTYQPPETKPDSDDMVSPELHLYDVDYFFTEGFKLGLRLGRECFCDQTS